MDPTRRVLLLDGLIALSLLVASAGLYDGVSAASLGIAALSAGATAAGAWGDEHGHLDYRATVLAVVAVGVVTLGLGLAGFAAFVSDVLVPSAGIGFGVGLLAYRFYFGVVKPVPERRLRGVRERGV